MRYRQNAGFKKLKPSVKINESFSLKSIRDPSKNLVVLDNKVIDLKDDFAKFHSGGHFLIQKNLGADGSRYFYGVYGMNKHFKAHKQSLYNWNWMEKRVAGVITENFDMQEKMFKRVSKTGSWRIIDRKPLTSLITRVSFRSKRLVPRPLMMCDPTTWGKHFKVKSYVTQ